MTIRRSWILISLVPLAACSGSDSPEQQVRAVIERMEQAAEDRDVRELAKHLSEDYRDAHGMGTEAAARYARGYFIANPSIHLLTRIEALTFPAPGEARARVRVGLLARESAETDRWDLAAELHTFKLALRQEDDAWKVSFLEVMRE